MLASTSDNSFIRYWFVTIDDGVDVSQRSVAAVLEDALADPKGWRRMGYRFARIPPSIGRKAREVGKVSYLGDTLDIFNVFWIRLAKPRTVQAHCSIEDRSCADLSMNMILLNSHRWLNGSKNSGMSLQTYRRALVLHELGHLLSFQHAECPEPGGPGDVMQEFTRLGWQGCKPSEYPTMKRTRETHGLARRRSQRI
jgi:uncharacterized protein DUF3152